jgi:hypothetical protein
MVKSTATDFEIHLLFTGLCMFVKNSGDPQKLHVLFIDPHQQPHINKVHFDTKYLPGNANPGRDFKLLKGELGLQIVNGGVTPVTQNVDLPIGVPNLNDVTQAKVKPDRITTVADPVNSMLTMTGATLRDFRSAGPFEFPTQTDIVYMTWQSGYSINANGEGLILTINGGSESIRFDPVSNLIELRMKSVVKAEDGFDDPPYPGGSTNDHFTHYYDLFDPLPKVRPTPKRHEHFDFKSSFYTCMQGGGGT